MVATMMRSIAAADSRLGIATDEGIPWHLPTDQQFFVDETREGIILMGYHTYREFKTPMHGRTNYVASRHERELKPGFVLVNNVAEFAAAHAHELINNIGGAGLFHSALDVTDELILTRIDGDWNCTKFFPSFETVFELANESDPVSENGSTYVFQRWHRRPLP